MRISDVTDLSVVTNFSGKLTSSLSIDLVRVGEVLAAKYSRLDFDMNLIVRSRAVKHWATNNFIGIKRIDIL